MERVKPNMIRVRQERYLLDPSAASKSSPSPYKYKWEVPLTWITSTSPKTPKQQWLHRNDPFIEITLTSGTLTYLLIISPQKLLYFISRHKMGKIQRWTIRLLSNQLS